MPRPPPREVRVQRLRWEAEIQNHGPCYRGLELNTLREGALEHSSPCSTTPWRCLSALAPETAAASA